MKSAESPLEARESEVTDMAATEESLALRVDLGRIAFLQQFTDVLLALDRAYNALYYFLDFARDLQDFPRHSSPYWRDPLLWAWHSPLVGMPAGLRRFQVGATMIARPEDFSTFVLPSDRLVLKACQISSPGWMDILGKLDPLRILRDLHEMRKDREYREEAEKEKLRLENELLRNQVIRERIDILKELGVPGSVLKEIVNLVLLEPIREVETHVDSGRIRGFKPVSLSTDE